MRPSARPHEDTPTPAPARNTAPAPAVLPGRAVALVVASVVVAFAPALLGDFVWDDVDLVRDNPWVRSPPSLRELVSTPFMHGLLDGPDVMPIYRWLHRPLTKLLLVAEHRAFGDAPLGYHLVNMALHAMAAVLIQRAAHTRLEAAGIAHASVAATVAALVFALHPSRVESVAWVSGVPDPLMVCFLVPALDRLRTARGASALACGALLVAAAGFAREAAIVAPLLVALDAFVAGRSRSETMRATLAAGVGAAAVVVSILVVGRDLPALRPLEGGAFLPRVLATLGGYARRALVPTPDTIWPYPLPLDARGVPTLPMHLVPFGLAALAVAAFWLLRARRGGLARATAAGLGFAAVTLAPASNLALRSYDTLTTDRYLYLPMAGLGLAFGLVVARAYASGEGRRALAQLGAAGVLLTYLLVDLGSSARFASNTTLFANEVTVHPTHLFAYRNLVAALAGEGALDEADRAARQGAALAAAQRRPEDELRFVTHHVAIALVRTSEADHEALAGLRAFLEALVGDGRLGFRDATTTYTTNASPALRRKVCEDVHLCLLSLARARVATQDLEAASAPLDALLARRPRDADAWALRAIVLARLGQFEAARETLARGDRATGGSPHLAPARQSVVEAEREARRPMPSPEARAMRDAEVALLLGSPEAARRALAPALGVSRPEPRAFLILAQAEVRDLRLEAAARVLLRARALHPSDAALAEASRRLAALQADEAAQRGRRGNPSSRSTLPSP